MNEPKIYNHEYELYQAMDSKVFLKLFYIVLA